MDLTAQTKYNTKDQNPHFGFRNMGQIVFGAWLNDSKQPLRQEPNYFPLCIHSCPVPLPANKEFPRNAVFQKIPQSSDSKSNDHSVKMNPERRCYGAGDRAQWSGTTLACRRQRGREGGSGGREEGQGEEGCFDNPSCIRNFFLALTRSILWLCKPNWFICKPEMRTIPNVGSCHLSVWAGGLERGW